METTNVRPSCHTEAQTVTPENSFQTVHYHMLETKDGHVTCIDIAYGMGQVITVSWYTYRSIETGHKYFDLTAVK